MDEDKELIELEDDISSKDIPDFTEEEAEDREYESIDENEEGGL